MTGTPDTEEHWATKSDNLEPDNLLWKQYNIYTDLFKFYVDTTLKATTWFYAITGAILVYYFDHIGNPYLRYSLLLPAVLSFGFYRIFSFGARQNKDLSRWLNYIRAQLNLPGRPHVEVLDQFLDLSSKLFLIVTLGLIIVFAFSFISFK